MGEKKKKPFYFYSRFWVLLYAQVVLLLMTIQLTVALLVRLGVDIVWINNNISNVVENTLETAAWFWTAIVSLFCGFDKFVDIKNTMNLASGQMSNGDMAKIRKIIIISLILSIYSIVCSFVVDLNFQVVAFFSSFGMSTVIYTSGNKIVKSLKYYPGSIDGDADGIPDVIQHRYEKWVREQKKNGTEQQFITLEYYLDTNPGDRAIIDKLHSNLDTQGGMKIKT